MWKRMTNKLGARNAEEKMIRLREESEEDFRARLMTFSDEKLISVGKACAWKSQSPYPSRGPVTMGPNSVGPCSCDCVGKSGEGDTHELRRIAGGTQRE
jgi:hypothetical protein